MPGFDQAWTAVAIPRANEPVSPELRPLLQTVYTQIISDPENFTDLKRGLQRLLQFLNYDGRTNANCWATDLFFGVCEGWERDWGDLGLPEQIHDVLSKMGEGLHDAVQAPDFARDFGCLPEQLLKQLGGVRIDLPMTKDASA